AQLHAPALHDAVPIYEDYEIEKFNEGNLHFSNARKESYKVMAEFTSGIGILSSVLNLLVISLGGYFVYREIINLGDLFSFNLYRSEEHTSELQSRENL